MNEPRYITKNVLQHGCLSVGTEPQKFAYAVRSVVTRTGLDQDVVARSIDTANDQREGHWARTFHGPNGTARLERVS